MIAAVHGYLMALEIDALRVDGPAMRCAWVMTLGAMELLAERAQLGGVG
jgi:hypothetical protein